MRAKSVLTDLESININNYNQTSTSSINSSKTKLINSLSGTIKSLNQLRSRMTEELEVIKSIKSDHELSRYLSKSSISESDLISVLSDFTYIRESIKRS